MCLCLLWFVLLRLTRKPRTGIETTISLHGVSSCYFITWFTACVKITFINCIIIILLLIILIDMVFWIIIIVILLLLLLLLIIVFVYSYCLHFSYYSSSCFPYVS